MLTALLAGVVCSATTLVGAAPGNAALIPDAPAWLSAEDQKIMVAQAPLMALHEKVSRLAAGQASSPLAGTRVDAANRRLHVYWAGAVPAELESLRRAAAAAGTSVVIERASFSELQLKDAANRLGAFAEATRTGLTVELKTDGSGLVVRSAGLDAAYLGRMSPTPKQARILNAIGTVRSRTGVRISVADRQAGGLHLADRRSSDTSPYWGGADAGHRDTNFGPCTSGFPMYATGAPTTRFMLTAAHCSGFTDGVPVTVPVPANPDDPGQRMGETDFIHELFDLRADRYDLGVVRIDAGRTNQGRVYLGEFKSDGGMRVRGYASGGITRNASYCINATVSAPNCNLLAGDQFRVCGDAVTPPIPFGRCIWYVGFTPRDPGVISICQGDSGGPVYYWDPANLIAAGVAAAATFPFLTPDGRVCGTGGAISVVATAANMIPGLRPVTWD